MVKSFAGIRIIYCVGAKLDWEERDDLKFKFVNFEQKFQHRIMQSCKLTTFDDFQLLFDSQEFLTVLYNLKITS